MAISYFYSQQELSSQFLLYLFTTTVRDKDNKGGIKLESFLDNLVNILLKDERGNWRPMHYLIAKEILKQILGGTMQNSNWKNNLSDYSIDLIQYCADINKIPSEHTLGVLQKLFVLRDNEELLGKEEPSPMHIPGSSPIGKASMFSALISDIPNENGKFRVFEKLTDCYPKEAHFWAHLARYYIYILRNQEKALISIQEAIELLPNDSSLYHMKGMCLRARVYDTVDKYTLSSYQSSFSEGDMNKTKNGVKDTSEQFEKCRDVAPNNSYGYVSQIQMIIKSWISVVIYMAIPVNLNS
ncbi:MAG: hypothetical protein GY765_34775 [bacterium]|nr:hypothetical protein [bacterium]